MTNKNYNGWHNYETWAIALWLDNEESSQSYWQSEAESALARADGDADQATFALENAIKEQHEEALPELQGFAADLLNAAMSEVNWREIARHLVDEVLAEQNA